MDPRPSEERSKIITRKRVAWGTTTIILALGLSYLIPNQLITSSDVVAQTETRKTSDLLYLPVEGLISQAMTIECAELSYSPGGKVDGIKAQVQARIDYLQGNSASPALIEAHRAVLASPVLAKICN